MALPESHCDRMALPRMYHPNTDPYGTAYCVTVDAATGVDTGISATDRGRAIAALADPGWGPGDFIRPGHVVPVRARS